MESHVPQIKGDFTVGVLGDNDQGFAKGLGQAHLKENIGISPGDVGNNQSAVSYPLADFFREVLGERHVFIDPHRLESL